MASEIMNTRNLLLMTVVERVRLFFSKHSFEKKNLHKIHTAGKGSGPKVLGFGSGDAVARSEFSSTRNVERYREKMKMELKLVYKSALKDKSSKGKSSKAEKSQVPLHFSIEYTPRPRSDVSTVTLPSTQNRERAPGP